MIFKKGDKVYDHAYGWGEVVKVCLEDGKDYQLRVNFLCNKEWYTREGKILLEAISPSLSFTEYTLEGFSQVRPKEPLPFKVGDVVYVGQVSYTWSTDILKTINKKDCLPFVTSSSFWKYLALENPLLNPDTKIYTKEDL